VAAEDVLVRGRFAFDVREVLLQDDEALLRLGVRPRRMEIRERAVADQLDGRLLGAGLSSELLSREGGL
jgi:hypothetical protein